MPSGLTTGSRKREEGMVVSGVHHTCVIVSDMAASLAFYRDLLGLKEDVNVFFDADPVMMGLPGTKPRQHIVFLSAGNMILELIQYLEPKGKPVETRTCDPGGLHLCFRVVDMEGTYEYLTSKGVKFHKSPGIIGEDGKGLAGHKYVYFRGPDNEVLELMQPPA